MTAPFRDKATATALADDLFLIQRGTGAGAEIEKVDPRASATATLIALGIDALIGDQSWRGSGAVTAAMIRNGAGNPTAGTGNNGDFYINTTAWTIWGPKASGAWPASGVSLIGPAGANGLDGDDGADGLSLRTGTGAPGAGTGNDGDWYIDSATFFLYGPKASGAWPAGVDLNGADGANGADGLDGRSLLAGTGAPSGATGSDGDWYIDTSTYYLYGPKASGAWPAGIDLNGADGADGAPGADGAAGADGRTLLNGSGAPSGGLGGDGDFYIDVDLWTIYGPKAGDAWGAATSMVGSDGTNGTDGTDGNTLLWGSGDPAGGTGVDGNFYINITAWTIFGPKTGGSWGAGTDILGADGANGADGAALAGVLSVSTTTRTAALTDAELMIEATNASGLVYTLPPNASVAFPVGTVIHLAADTAGTVSFAAGAGVTIKKPAAVSLDLAGQDSLATAAKVATDTWRVFGDLGSA